MKTMGRLGFVTLLLFLLSATAVWAQAPTPGPSEDQSANQADPPGRAARLQYITGSVSVQPEGNGDWVEGAVNRPLTNADNVWTDKDSRAEVNVGSGLLRMDSESSLTITNINENTVQVQLHQGTLSLEVRRLYSGEGYEVDTPNMAFTVQKPGEYRFEVDPNADASRVIVWKGEGDATGEGPAVHVSEHQSARFSNGTSLAHEMSPAPGYDGFDDWGHIRDRREQGSVSARYVAPGVVGYEDLDEYGSWRNEPTYGEVWYPSGVTVGWAPYSYGRWVWVSPWGWTWVDDAPWGFAPFHYGRWVYAGGFWGWAPGPVYVRPYYAPALVAWFGGAGWGVGVGFGGGFGYGWCPLGWNEPFIPWYHHSFGYYRNVNVTNIHITNVNVINRYYGGHETFRGYSNLRYPGGAVAVSRETIVGGRSVHNNMVRVSANQFSRASLGGRIDLAPTRESRFGGSAGRGAAVPPQHAFSRPVVSRMALPSHGTQSFGGQRGMQGPGGVQATHETAGRGFSNMNRNVPRPGNTQGSFNQRSEANSNIRTNPAAERGSFSNRNEASANVPRPGNTNQGSFNQRNEANSNLRTNPGAERGSFSNRSQGSVNVPRPPANTVRGNGNEHSYSAPQHTQASGGAGMNGSVHNNPSMGGRPAGSSMPAERSAPRPSEGNTNRGGNRGGDSHGGPRADGRSMNYVPRPSGPVQPAANYSASRSYSGQSSRSYSPNSRETYGSSYSARTPYAGSYGRSSRNSYPQYSAPRYSAPQYSSRSGGYSAPSYRSAAPSYRSSGPSYHASAPSYHGGGGGGSYHGGGGGGHASSGHSGRGR